MKKIMIIAQGGLNRGGIQTVIMNYVRNLSANYRFDIVLFTNEIRDYDDEFMSYGGSIFRICYTNNSSRLGRQKEKFLRATKGYYDLMRIINNNGPYEAIHCHNGIESITALKAARKCGIKKRITQAHVIFDDSSNNIIFRLKNLYLKWQIKRNSTLQIGCSDFACRSSFLGRYQVILNPYNETLFKGDDKVNTSFSSPVLIQVGNLSDLKNQMYSLRIIKRIKQIYPDCLARIIGSGDQTYERSLRDYIKNNDLKNNVIFYPASSDIPTLMNESSYLIQPSRTESFCIVLVEAQVMGLSCFASDVIPEEANAGGVRYLSIKDDPKKWADAIIADFKQTKGMHKVYDCNKYKSSEITKIIDLIYKD